MKTLLFKSVVLLLSFGLFSNCDKNKMPDPAQNPSPAPEASLRYLALGDSYTIGQSVAANERFPFLTTAMLRAQHLPFADPKYIATTGWTTEDLMTAISAQEPLGTYDIVTLLIGVNDQYQGSDTASYRTRFTGLLNKAVVLAGNRSTHVFVLSIPDYSATPFVANGSKARVHAQLELFNAINKEVTLQNKIAYIDITPLTREAGMDANLLASDGLHYSGKEHQKWAGLLAPVIKQNLK